MFEKTGDRQLSAWEAGILTRRYGLDKEMVMDFFKENHSGWRFASLWPVIDSKVDPTGYYLALINYTIASSLRFTVPSKYYGAHNHKKVW